MSNKRDELGRGIRALLENIDTSLNSETTLLSTTSDIPLEQIEVNPFQPRHDFDEQSLNELAESIRVHGIIQPITVRKISAKKYQLIAGERRLRAARMVGLKMIPAFMRTADDEQMLEMALIENTHREDLNAIEVALNYKRLIDECNLKQEELAEKVGRDRSTVTNFLRLLKLPPDIQKALKEKAISMAHARSLITIDDPITQLQMYHEIVKNELSVRATEQLARQFSSTKKSSAKKDNKLPAAYQRLQDKLCSQLSTKVELRQKRDGKGEIVISYFSQDDLERLVEMLGV